MDNEFDIRNGVLDRYNGSNERVIIPESVTEISDEVFEKNKTMKLVEIPSTVISIDSWLFFQCDNLDAHSLIAIVKLCTQRELLYNFVKNRLHLSYIHAIIEL